MRRFCMGITAAAVLLIVTANGAWSAVGAVTPHPNFAAMSGKNEISATGKKRAGDPNGAGSFAAVIDRDTNQLCFGLTVRDISNPTAAHIHKGRRGKNGPIVITLTAPSTGDPGASSGCVNADPSLLGKIRKRPHRYYVNVHTADFPGGAVRGQMFQRGAR
jgi:hypothetical protein